MIYQNGVEVYEQWEKIPVLNDGFICLSDHMGNDMKIASRARTSYGNDTRITEEELADKYFVEGAKKFIGAEATEISYDDLNSMTVWDSSGDVLYEGPVQHETAQQVITYGMSKTNDDLRKSKSLIRRLLRHGHTSPFEFCEVEFLVRVPMDCWRQWVRHRTANINEYSTRYSDAIDSQQKTAESEWRLQATENKQGSSGFLTKWPEGTKFVERVDENDNEYIEATLPNGDIVTGMNPARSPGAFLEHTEREFHDQARILYEERLALGVAREQARKDLPLSTYTEAYWKCDLHNIFNFLRLRMDPHAQLEIRLYANAVASVVKGLFPIAYEAFEDYQLNAMKLTALDIRVIQSIIGCTDERHEYIIGVVENVMNDVFDNKTERLECVTKLQKLGMI